MCAVDRRIERGLFVELFTHEAPRREAVGEGVLAELGLRDAAVVGCLCNIEPVLAGEIQRLGCGHACLRSGAVSRFARASATNGGGLTLLPHMRTAALVLIARPSAVCVMR